jgi:hypothetical protein
MADPASVVDAVDDYRPVVGGQELDGLEAGDGGLGQVDIGVVQQLVDAPRDPKAGGVVGQYRVSETKDQRLRR